MEHIDVPTTLNNHAKIILAAVQLEEKGQIPFTKENLIIEVWKRYPYDFGLNGHEPEHPDSHKVLYNLCGCRGLVAQQMLRRIDATRLVLTPKARELAYEVSQALDIALGKATPTPLPKQNGLPQDLNAFLARVLDGVAYQKFVYTEQGHISLTDAYRFWGFPENGPFDVHSYLQSFTAHMNGLRIVMKGSRGEIVLENGRAVTWDDIARIEEAQDYLLKKFTRPLSLLKSRKVASND